MCILKSLKTQAFNPVFKIVKSRPIEFINETMKLQVEKMPVNSADRKKTEHRVLTD